MITLSLEQGQAPVRLTRMLDAANVPGLKKRLSGPCIDLTCGIKDARTVEHYSLQWGSTVGFQRFARGNSEAVKLMPARQLGWPDLFKRIRARARTRPTRVYDAGCGFGGIMDELFREPAPAHLIYVGADIHDAVGDIAVPQSARDDQIFLFRFDISDPLPVSEPFDFVVCRASIHHTADPPRTFASLSQAVAARGRLAISAYAKKGRLRELVDDAVRDSFKNLSSADGLRVAEEFTALGKALQQVAGTVRIERDLRWLGIAAGEYELQQLIYDCMIKCWYNPKFGEKFSSIVNFDWYHPTYAYRYDIGALRDWFVEAGFKVEREISTKAQHYLEGRPAMIRGRRD